jgi:hypothetical protein
LGKQGGLGGHVVMEAHVVSLVDPLWPALGHGLG